MSDSNTYVNPYRQKLLEKLDEKVCPTCGCERIGVDNWGMFPGEKDWFYYCLECDDTFK